MSAKWRALLVGLSTVVAAATIGAVWLGGEGVPRASSPATSSTASVQTSTSPTEPTADQPIEATSTSTSTSTSSTTTPPLVAVVGRVETTVTLAGYTEVVTTDVRVGPALVRLASGLEFSVPADTELNRMCDRGTFVVTDSKPRCFILVAATGESVAEVVRVLRVRNVPVVGGGEKRVVSLSATVLGVEGQLVLIESRGSVVAVPLGAEAVFQCGGDPIVPPDYPTTPDQIINYSLRFDIDAGVVDEMFCIQE